MFLRTEVLAEKKLVGKSLSVSFANNRTTELWRGFMSRRGEIKNSIGQDLYSLEVYAPHFFDSFDPTREFDKWAAVEVADLSNVPDGLQTMVIRESLYAVFLHKGLATDASTYQYIFMEWLPKSGYAVDDRPHFAVMGQKYKGDSADSEEEIWIPIV
ncbi:GyrI-like domain-containing protein [uncultured Mucilaginibacter sp.]|uniref:GyrI-like domain-containing protein n=1 Tax=uncultured Mucilaginibacter sp. TaxID=797541 RepID=UPI0025E24189|nr:GyrI-like domain-containing protein [uncultured Mucilaginibacter sp.]